MNTRSQKRFGDNTDTDRLSECLNETMMDLNVDDLDEAPLNSDQSEIKQQLNALIIGMSALQASVERLSQDNSRSQAAIFELRHNANQPSSNLPLPQRTSATQPQTANPTTVGILPSTSLSSVTPSIMPQPSSTLQNPLSLNNYGPVVPIVSDFAAKLFPLPPFDGNPEDWPLFFANFKDSTNEFGYNNKQNLIRLHKAIGGYAKQAVTSLLIYPEDVPKVIEELQFNFGRPDLLVRSQLEKIQSFPIIYENCLDNVFAFSNRVRNVVAFFKSAKCDHHLMNPTLLEELVNKLPPSKQYEWARYAAKFQSFPTVVTFSDWITDLAKVVCLMPPNFGSSNVTQQETHIRHIHTNAYRPAGQSARRILHNNQASTVKLHFTCIICKENHKTIDCNRFKKMKLDEKWEHVKRNSLCFSCLQKGHSLTTCNKRKTCGINGCIRMHHQSLHQDAKTTSYNHQDPSHVLNCRQNHQTNQLFKILPVILSGPLGSMPVYAMFDDGSSISLIQENVAEELGLRGDAQPLTLQWYGEKRITEDSKRVAIDIKGQFNGAENFSLKNVRTVKSLNLPKQSFNKACYNHFNALPLNNYEDAKPILLIGLDNCFLGTATDTVEVESTQPIASLTRLGWIAYGPINMECNPEPRVLHIRETLTSGGIDKIVEEYFAVENFGIKISDAVVESDENRRARQILVNTTKKLNMQFETGLLWRRDNTNLPSSFAMAKKRLFSVENKMSKDVVYAAKYKEEIAKYIQKDYAKLLPPHEAELECPTTWYLPHFGVVNPNKPNKFRIVFDAAAATSNISLNSALLKGPDHAKPLLAILHKFREGVVGVAGDIQEMFPQVKIRPEDQNSQRFLWRDGDTSQPIRVYCMTSMIFGSICSPCCAEYVKNTNALEYLADMPRGAKATIENMYVDDLVISFNSEHEAEEVCLETIKINAAAGFKLRSFVSNNKKLQKLLNNDEINECSLLSMEGQLKTDKILGMYWNTRMDAFEFHSKFHKIPRDVLENKRSPTKRELLAIVMSIFDPFGLLANITLAMKLLLQETWKSQIQWDDPLPPKLSLQWSKWWREFEEIKHFSVPRCYSPYLPVADEIQLHVFVDASSSAYAAVTYLRIKKGDNMYVSFIAAKTRCAPIKGMSIPRLELQAAVLGSRLRKSIEECQQFQVNKTTYWSDSKTVILWIRSTTREYKQFVAARIADIVTDSNPSQWRWLPTALNVADEATRPNCNFSSSNWLIGPKFLRQEEEFWPQEPSQLTSESCVLEEKLNRLLVIDEVEENFIDLSRYSSYLKMLRIVTWIFRFVHNVKSKIAKDSTEQIEELSAPEIQSAEKYIIRQVQAESFSEEIATLRSGRYLPKSSSIYELTPYLDEDGLLRVKGRIDAAYCLPFTARRPIVLPQKHQIARLIMIHYHNKRHHQNDQLTINEMRQKFWVSHGRALLKSVKKKCSICIYHRAKPEVPLMGQLPSDRLTPYVRPFSYTGVDYCGPFSVTLGRRREKRWIALFTCLTTRAIHLEVAQDLSTDAFLLCFRNFVNRRGTPVKIRSDNGTNFIGAQKKLLQENRLFDFNRLECHMSSLYIEWIFNCPSNPSAGGCWERLIQCVKRLLERVLKEESPRVETFRSAIIEAENIINSRPLVDLPMLPGEEEPFTPNHFLVGCLNSTQTPCANEQVVCLRKQWRIAQNLKDRIWKRWINEYLPQLLRRSKWREETEPLQLGQLVIICDARQPRSQWEKGRVTKLFAGKDGCVRSAEVRTIHGDVHRPVSKLAVLKFSESP